MTSGDGSAGSLRNGRLFPVSEFDLPGTLDGGQAFRWHRPCDSGAYRGVVGRSVLEIGGTDGGIVVRVVSGEDATPDAVANYLGLEVDLEAFRERYARDDGLGPATATYIGLRVLRQDPWECLCGFICSANSSIARIKLNMAEVARTLGERIGPGDEDFAFPGADRVAAAGEDRFRELGLGFHARYLVAAAMKVDSGALDLSALSKMPYEMARSVLDGLPGVGRKIADCVLAFSLGHGEAFPVDRWVRRAMEEWYKAPRKMSNDAVGDMARERFGADAAYANQYLFHRQRLAAQGVS